MTELGRSNDLRVIRLTPQGALLDAAPIGEALLPAGEVPAGAGPGSVLTVFVYIGMEDCLMATTATPLVQVGEVAYLKIVKVNDAGAFLAWGLPKDLLLPWDEVKREQKRLLVEGRRILVAVFRAEDGRIAASARLNDFLEDEAPDLKEGDRLPVIVAEPTDLGARVVVGHRYWGLVHANEIFAPLARGQKFEGYVKAPRPDGKVNIALSAPGYAKVDAVAEKVLGVLKRRGGFLAVTDKSKPEEIYTLFGISKKVFKLTLGALYKARKITLEPDGIRLVR